MFEDLLRQLALDTHGLASRLRALLDGLLARPVLVSVVLPSGATSASASHGLGRAYRGGFVVGSSSALALTVDLPGANSAQLVTVRASAAPGSDVTIKLVVF